VTALETADLLMRGAVLGLEGLIAALLLRHHRRSEAGRLGAFFAVVICLFMLCPIVAGRPGVGLWAVPLYLGCFAGAGAFWLFARAWFDDTFRLSAVHVAVVVGLIFVHALAHLWPGAETRGHGTAGGGWLGWLRHGLAVALDVAFTTAGLYEVWRGRDEDLVEERRRIRNPFVIAIGGFMLVVIAAEVVGRGRGWGPALSLVNAAGTLGLTAAFALVALRLRGVLFEAPAVREGLAESAASVRPALSAADQRLLGEIEAFMGKAYGYREPGLTIGLMSERLRTQEYRLRRLINGQLNFRNFNEFVNSFRLAEVKSKLADPAHERTPILNMALDAGFQSLGPFNRAFKASTGITPQEYRRTVGTDKAA
jgi:AraC-like DNA-binding protein